ncbi:VOC family protein [soil metagenome]
MPVSALHHYTIRCTTSELDVLRDFYTRHIGLTVGARPEIPAPGHWLYAGGQPIVHLYAIADLPDPLPPPGVPLTGPLDHIAFRSHGLLATRAHLSAHGIAYDEAPVPGWPLHQVFVWDPKGLKIELTFWLDEESEAVEEPEEAPQP